MRRTSILASALALATTCTFAFSTPSSAAGRSDDWVCWMQPSGVTTCAYVPEPYHVRDIPYKPHKHRNSQKCRHCSVDFRLSHPNIRDFGNYLDNSTMRRFHDATLYGEKYRGIHD
ncbi:MAG: hypothetical protein ACT4N2_13445 [Hyphomicrobium sp.]